MDDPIDLHYYFLLQTFRRNRDGIHWSPEANRYVTNSVLTHISLAMDIPLPNRNVTDYALKRVIYMSELAQGRLTEEEIQEKIKNLDNISKMMVREGGPGEVQLPPVDQLNNEMPPLGPNPYPNMHPMMPMSLSHMSRFPNFRQQSPHFGPMVSPNFNGPNWNQMQGPVHPQNMFPWNGQQPNPWQGPAPGQFRMDPRSDFRPFSQD